MAYSILSLDGGGAWALIQARVLQDLYGDMRGHALLKKFDLVIANSGGSLVLACLCHNMKLSEIIEVFHNKAARQAVFSELTFWEKLKRRNRLSFLRNWLGVGPQYSTDRKLEGLFAVLKTYDAAAKNNDDATFIIHQPLDALPGLIGKKDLQLVIVGFDYFRQRVTFFRSNPQSNTDRFGPEYYRITLAHAIHASSNAPVNYFDKPAAVTSKQAGAAAHKTRKNWYWDGAVAGFNNPVLAGFIEAITNGEGRPMNDYHILSLGTGLARKAVITGYPFSNNAEKEEIFRRNQSNPFVVSDVTFRFMDDVSKMAKSIVNDPPDAATFMVYAMLEPRLTNNATLVRINPYLAPELDAEKTYTVPDVYKHERDGMAKFRALMNLDMDAVKDSDLFLISDMCDKFITESEPCLPNQLIRGTKNDTLYLGHKTYKEAKARWLQLTQEQHTTSNDSPLL